MTTMHTPGPLFPRRNSAGMFEVFVSEKEYAQSTAFITRTDDVGEANARLYAAAPDLLAALRGLIGAINLDHPDAHDAVAEAERVADLAIAKATAP